MPELLIELDEKRAAAMQAAVLSGLAVSVQEVAEQAIDAWLADQTLSRVDDAALQKLWQDGLESGE